jgi:aminopeptidase-like protein
MKKLKVLAEKMKLKALFAPATIGAVCQISNFLEWLMKINIILLPLT